MRYVQQLRLWRPPAMLVLWAVFAFGLLLQSAAPHLRIAHNSFVIPSELTARGAINPAAIIARDRIVQSLSAILTFSGAVGLALCHIRRQRRALRATQFAGNPSR